MPRWRGRGSRSPHHKPHSMSSNKLKMPANQVFAAGEDRSHMKRNNGKIEVLEGTDQDRNSIAIVPGTFRVFNEEYCNPIIQEHIEQVQISLHMQHGKPQHMYIIPQWMYLN